MLEFSEEAIDSFNGCFSFYIEALSLFFLKKDAIKMFVFSWYIFASAESTVLLYDGLIRSVKTILLRFWKILWSDVWLPVGSLNLWKDWSFIMNLLTISSNHVTGSFPRHCGELMDLSHFQGVGRCHPNYDSLLIAFAVTESFKASSLWGNLMEDAWQDVKCQLKHHVTG